MFPHVALESCWDAVGRITLGVQVLNNLGTWVLDSSSCSTGFG